MTVTDSGSNATTVALGTLTVEPALTVAVAPVRSAWDADQALAVSALVTGGTGIAELCTWEINGTSVGAAQSCNQSINVTGVAGTPTTVQVDVTDSSGGSAQSPLAAYTPSQAPLVGVVQTASNRSALHRAGGLQFNVTIEGGSAPFSIAWSINGLNVSGATSDSLVWIPTSPENVTAIAWVTDAANDTVASLPVTAHGGVLNLTSTGPSGTSPGSVDETGWYVAGIVAAAAVALIILMLILLQSPRRPPRAGPGPRPPRRNPPPPREPAP